MKTKTKAVLSAEPLSVHLISGLGLALTLFLAHNLYSINLVSHPSLTLFLISVIQCPIVLLFCSRYRKNRERCSYLKAVGRGLLGLPIACVFGSSWKDWQRIFANTKPIGSVDFIICLSAHGAVIGAWLGAWPMPLDWERPWQEWPICVSYGAMAGYLVAMVASFGFVLVRGRLQLIKPD